MLLNIVMGFIIPWIIASFLCFKDRKVLLIIAPFTSMLSYTINSIAILLGYWKQYPFEYGVYSTIPVNLGLYPVSASYFIYFINKSKLNNNMIIIIFTTLITGIEWLGILSGRVVYGNGWNLVFTFFSYLISYLLNYWFYIELKKIRVFE